MILALLLHEIAAKFLGSAVQFILGSSFFRLRKTNNLLSLERDYIYYGYGSLLKSSVNGQFFFFFQSFVC
ncbi:hypothetical protein ES288_A10G076400v1 [Gossypium darwinii]|uniref:Uncharacterized protein n=1 Tax=Gossypium darwinii TaxID=34276 RepID=A0A5D2EY86_GOSDA|nr:hypothetical protein ES288_A10G076400v1 [Gossypium darwinii]